MQRNWRWDWQATPLADLHVALNDVLDELSTNVGSAADKRYPRIDMVRTARGLRLYAALPGAKRDEVRLAIKGQTLTLEGERPAPALDEGATLVRQELFTGRFVRQLELPEAIDPKRVSARMEHGILTVELPFPVAAEPQKIEIDVE